MERHSFYVRFTCNPGAGTQIVSDLPNFCDFSEQKWIMPGTRDYDPMLKIAEAVGKKLIVFVALVVVQVAVAVVYKIAQKDGTYLLFSSTIAIQSYSSAGTGKYSFSPASALVLAEIFKTMLSSILLIHSRDEHTLRDKIEAGLLLIRETSPLFRLQTAALAFSYAVNNQIGFSVFLIADAASITLFKSGSSLISALMLLVFVGRQIFPLQWAAIAIQVMGLVTALYDPCTGASLLSAAAYILLAVHVAISCVNGVWNEHLVKNYTVNLHAQNIILYVSGSAFNLLFYLVVPTELLGTSSTGSFFHGYTPSAWLVVFMNSIIGIVIVAVYKHADVLVKTFGLACATGILYFINFFFFGWSVTIVGGAVRYTTQIVCIHNSITYLPLRAGRNHCVSCVVRLF
jgi:hypothetical protein